MANAELSRSLQPRHLAMISIGGIIGAGLFVGSSASIAAVGPAIVVSYLITALAGELHVGVLALAVVVLAYLILRARRRSQAAAVEP
jgi:L-asparagine transporter-like permease